MSQFCVILNLATYRASFFFSFSPTDDIKWGEFWVIFCNCTSNLLWLFWVSFPSVLPVTFPKLQSLHSIHAHHLFFFFFLCFTSYMPSHKMLYYSPGGWNMIYIYIILFIEPVFLMMRVKALVFEGHSWINRLGLVLFIFSCIMLKFIFCFYSDIE